MERLSRAERLTPEKIELKIRRLNRRSYSTLEALHYMTQADGQILCLDTNMVAASETELDAAVLAYIDAHLPHEIPHPAHAEEWRAFVAAEPVSERLLPTRWGRPLRVTVVHHA